MRGKVDDIETGDLIHGITPAYAGKSPLPFTAAVAGRDHPRVCGEKVKIIALLRVFTGSPPRMRGKAESVQTLLYPDRITPAYAGKRFRDFLWSRLVRDHPRVCGEKNSASSGLWPKSGSPPRMRGKVRYTFCSLEVGRITPAYAGKRSLCHPSGRPARDHPRVCGEKTKKIP